MDFFERIGFGFGFGFGIGIGFGVGQWGLRHGLRDGEAREARGKAANCVIAVAMHGCWVRKRRRVAGEGR